MNKHYLVYILIDKEKHFMPSEEPPEYEHGFTADINEAFVFNKIDHDTITRYWNDIHIMELPQDKQMRLSDQPTLF